MTEAVALPVDTGLTQTSCLWISRTKLLYLQLACSCWASRSRGYLSVRRLSEKWAAGRRTFNICKVSWFFVLTHIFPPFLFHSCASNNKSRKISANTVYTQATGMCLHVCSRRHTHKEKRANASRLTPSSNPCWSQPFLPASIFSLPPSLSLQAGV